MKFISRFKAYKIVLRPARYVINAYGERNFIQGVHAKFVDSIFETNDTETIELLLKKKEYGVDYWSADPNIKTTISEESKMIIEEEKRLTQMVGETAYSCEVCGKKVSTKLALAGHKRSHK